MSDEPPERTAIVLVHGVGDPNPGDLLRDFTAALAAEDGARLVLDTSETVWLEDRSHPPSHLRRFFPVPVREGALDGRRIVFAEVFWGQTSRVAQGLMGALRGLLSLIFGLQAIISGNRRERPPSGIEGWATRFGSFGAGILRGPVFAVNVLLLAATLALGLALVLFASDAQGAGGRGADPRWAWPVVLSGAAFTFGIGLWVLGRGRRPEGFQGVLAFEEYRAFGWSCLAVAVLWPLGGWVTGADSWEEWAAAAGLPLLFAFTLVSWCLMIVLLLHLVTLLSTAARPHDPVRRSLTAKTIAFALQFGLWATAVPLLWLVIIGVIEKPPDGAVAAEPALLIDLFHRSVPAEGLQWLAIPVILLAFLVTWFWRRARARSAARGAAGLPPRLIVGGLVHATIVLLAFYGVLAATRLFLESPAVSAMLPAWAGGALRWIPLPADLLAEVREHELRITSATGFLLGSSLLLGGIRAALDIANDVINYVRFNIAFDKRNVPRGGEPYEWLRPIRGKFNEVIRHLDLAHGFDRLVIVAHSQGTVIALDELAHSNFGRGREWLQGIDVRLVTMGSPAAHLYQHYFPVAYPEWGCAEYWGELPLRLDGWLNLYRIEDFVGTTMGMGKEDAQCLGFSESCVGSEGGHINYWRDRRVIREILAAGVFETP